MRAITHLRGQHKGLFKAPTILGWALLPLCPVAYGRSRRKAAPKPIGVRAVILLVALLLATGTSDCYLSPRLSSFLLIILLSAMLLMTRPRTGDRRREHDIEGL